MTSSSIHKWAPRHQEKYGQAKTKTRMLRRQGVGEASLKKPHREGAFLGQLGHRLKVKGAQEQRDS